MDYLKHNNGWTEPKCITAKLVTCICGNNCALITHIKTRHLHKKYTSGSEDVVMI